MNSTSPFIISLSREIEDNQFCRDYTALGIFLPTQSTQQIGMNLRTEKGCHYSNTDMGMLPAFSEGRRTKFIRGDIPGASC